VVVQFALQGIVVDAYPAIDANSKTTTDKAALRILIFLKGERRVSG
jgi:hypothetical protein